MLSPAKKTKLIEKQKAERAGKAAVTGATAKPLKVIDDNCLVSSANSVADLQKDNARLKRQLKLTKAALVTTILEGNKSDLLDDEGSSNFNLVMESMQDRYPDLHNGIVLAHTTKALDLQKGDIN